MKGGLVGVVLKGVMGCGGLMVWVNGVGWWIERVWWVERVG